MVTKPNSRTQTRSKAQINSGFRIVTIALALVTGSILGSMLAIGWGENFQSRNLPIERFGIIHRLSLPTGMHKREDISKFEIELDGADDFARLSTNNYWVMSTEDQTDLILDRLDHDQAAVNVFLRTFAVQRNHGNGRLEKGLHLRQGRNFLVFELENGKEDYCSGGFHLFVNGQELSGLPGVYPVSADEVHSLVRRTRTLADVLCSRRIVELDLGVKPEPLRRFRQLLGL